MTTDEPISGATPADPAAPASAVPAAGVAPPRPTSNRTALIVAAVLALTLLAGGAGALVASLAGSKHAAADTTAHGQQLADRQQQQQKPRDHVPPPSTVPVPGPQPSQPVTTEAPSTTTTTPPGTSGPGTGTGSSLDLGHNITTTIPSGWKVDRQNSGGTYLSGNGAVMDVLYYSTQKGEGADSVLERRSKELSSELSQVQIGGVKVATIPSARVIEAISGQGTGYLASQSGGTIPVEALFYVYVRQDGLGVVVQTLCARGSFSKHADDFQAIFNGVVATI